MDQQAEIGFFRNLPIKDQNAVTFGFGFALMLLLNLKGAVHASGTPHGLELLETFLAL